MSTTPSATDSQGSTALGDSTAAPPAPAPASSTPAPAPTATKAAKSLVRKSTLSLKSSLSTLSGVLTALSASVTSAGVVISLIHSSQASADLAIGGAAATFGVFLIHQITQDIPGA